MTCLFDARGRAKRPRWSGRSSRLVGQWSRWSGLMVGHGRAVRFSPTKDMWHDRKAGRMALRRLLADPFTRSELARSGLEELSRNLWPGHCLTCGDELADTPPAVLAFAEDTGTVTVTLHHPGCRRAQWTQHDPGFLGQYLSTTVALLSMPFGDASTDPFRPTLVANPALEQVSLSPDESGRYRATTVESYRSLGLAPPGEGLASGGDDTVAAWLTTSALLVRCGNQYWHLAIDPAEPLVAEVQRQQEVVLAVTSAVNPAELVNPEPLKRALRADDLALIRVPLHAAEEAPELDRHAVVVDSEFATADENEPSDWLPDVEYYRGPSYNPDTGRFVCGLGMDGPSYWALNTPGLGVHPGLIAGPAEIGKTNQLRILLVEAASSGVFTLSVADPRNRNGLVEVFGSGAVIAADDVDGTIQLLRAAVAMIEYRAQQGSWFRDPSREAPGMVIAVDDGHEVFCDPTAADLAATVATAGPAVGLGLVVATETVDPEAFAGRRDLLQALSDTNSVVFDQAQLDQLQRIRATS